MSDFYIALVNVKYAKPTETYLRPTERKSVIYLNELIEEMNKTIKVQIERNGEPSKKYLMDNLDDLFRGQTELEIWANRQQDIKCWTKLEIEENEYQMETYKEVNQTCNDGIFYLVEKLAAYFLNFFIGKNGSRYITYFPSGHKAIQQIKWLNETKSKLTVESNISKPDFKTQHWFNVGLLFASGEMAKLKIEYSSNSTKIAQYLGNEKGLRPYISSSINEEKRPKSDKNIFSSPDKLLKIFNHCNENKIEMTTTFIRAYKEQNPLE